MYTESKIYVEYIETEISAGSHPRTVRLAVGALRLFVNLQAEHTKRQVEAHVLHYEYAHAGAEIQTHFSDVRTGVARQAVVDTENRELPEAKDRSTSLNTPKRFARLRPT